MEETYSNGLREKVATLQRDSERADRRHERLSDQITILRTENAEHRAEMRNLDDKIDSIEARVKSMTTALYGCAAAFVTAAIAISMAVSQ